ncbi:ubiquinone biosynthesis accessory factor UbiJ [Methyloversatilis thermotolerans]|uniref:ubiquinone biosynthesis accessory factor UbiJ n=1 Tax=Methyloversatilis thermotolerans TaxID=1346290 RepID=UPI00037212D9|nr:SCP2 sterol-binding domain-containing protein [Methyloversatilis thermotolerans]
MLATAALRILNHLIGHTPGAAARLARHQGARARLSAGGLAVDFRIDGDGRFVAADDGTPQVILSLQADALFRQAYEAGALTRGARIEGDAALAESLGQVLKTLRWDAAEDLSRVVGDPLAERMVGTASQVAAGVRDLGGRMASALGEYAADEAGLLLRPSALSTFSDRVDTLRDDLARLEKRISRLERR